MNESDAKAAFRAMGITSPSRTLIEMWLSAARYAERQEAEQVRVAASPEPAPGPKEAVAPSKPAQSRLEPLLRDQGTLMEARAKRRPGRPRIIASWFPAVAETMADGTTLRTALAINRLTLGPS